MTAKNRAKPVLCAICKLDHELSPHQALRVQSQTPGRLSTAFRGVPRGRITKRPKPKKWSMLEILVHLRDCEIVYGSRIRKMIAEEGGELVPFDQDRWADGLAYRRESPTIALESFVALRRANVALLAALGPKVLERHGIHPAYGRLTVRDLAVHWAAHDEKHIHQIRAIRNRRV
ncbi:MAG: DinB family protein [Planctomycetes bacterium]|nr:DinB family protein [Planctomycetota bacterium]MBI3847541.1 DinB family protein [Planctomycetota bacterium]